MWSVEPTPGAEQVASKHELPFLCCAGCLRCMRNQGPEGLEMVELGL